MSGLSQNTMLTRKSFVAAYTRAMAAAALAFGVLHALQLFAFGLYNQRSWDMDPTGFITLILFALFESTVFFLLGLLLAYIPSFLVASIVLRRNPGRSWLPVVLGSLLGIAFVPVCASVTFVTFMDTDDPSYLARCAEFTMPLALAGTAGGYVFWRHLSRRLAKRDNVPGQFD